MSMLKSPTRLRVSNFNIVTAVDVSEDAEAEAKNYVLLALPRDSVYFDWRYKREQAFGTIVKVDRTPTRTFIDVTLSVTQAGRDREFVFSIPFGWLQSAHMFSVHQNDSAMFLIRSEDDVFQAERVHDFASFGFTVAAPEEGSAVSDRLMNVFQEVLADRAIYNLSQKEYDTIRGDTLSLVLALARGDHEALNRVLSFAPRYDAARGKTQDKDYEPDLQEKQMLFTRLHIARLLHMSHPAQFAARGDSIEQLQKNRETISEFEQIMQQNDLGEAFSELTDSYVQKPQQDADDDAKMTYFASSTTHTPASMAPLVGEILRLRALERNWNADPVEVDVDEVLPDGDSLVSGFIVVALRIARLRELSQNPEETFHPSFLVQSALSMDGEPPFWVYQQIHRLLGAGDSYPFEDFLLSQLPRELPEGVPLEMLITTPPGNAFHNLGHLILKDELGRTGLRHAFADLPIISSFLEDLFEQAAQQAEQPEEEEHACPSVIATLNTLRLDFERAEIIAQLGRAYLALAELNALRDTEHLQDSAEWRDYLQEYLYRVSD